MQETRNKNSLKDINNYFSFYSQKGEKAVVERKKTLVYLSVFAYNERETKMKKKKLENVLASFLVFFKESRARSDSRRCCDDVFFKHLTV